ncbi:membrane protein [Hoeflea sp. BAL378]|nr:membrane protein [Hoeflea sp. BAL378]
MFFDTWSGLGRILATGLLAYPAVILMLRISGKRTLSKFNAFDFIVTIALGSMLASVIVTGSVPLAEGLLALAMLIGLQYGITWLSVRSDRFQTLIKSNPRLLVHRGIYQDRAMRDERVTRAEIAAALHAQGKAEVSDLSVILETDGSLNVFAPA